MPIVAPMSVQANVTPDCGGTLAVTVLFGQVVAGAEIVAIGAGLMATVALPLPLQLLVFVTVTESVTLPELPAVKVIAFVPWPAVMPPLAIVQVYVAPVTVAVLALPEPFVQRLAGAETVGTGDAVTLTFVGADVAEQLPYDAVTV